ncbi:MAG: ATP-binding protein [Thermoproteota archaeon]
MLKRELVEDFFSRKIGFTGIRRELEIKPIANKIISIVGPRRSGKTWFFYSLFEILEKPMYVSFEDIAFRNILAQEFFEVIKIFSQQNYEPKTLLLDEVQNLQQWEILVRSLQDRGFRIYLTGSSSKLLPREVSTELRGRSITYLLLPFSFREFATAKNIDLSSRRVESVGSILRSLKEYLKFGGFPEVIMGEKERILKEYCEEIFYKDFVERHEIKSLEFGRFLFEFMVQNFSKESSLRKIRSFFGKKISYTTLYDYVEKLQDTLTVFFLERFSKSVYLRRSWPRKIYICDMGIPSVFQFSEKIGDRMENAVFLELKRRQNEYPLLEFFYWKDRQQNEVDFVIKEGLKIKQLIQVTYASGKDEVEKREIKGLMKAGKELKCKDLLIITWDYEDEIEIENRKIVCKPLWRWLIEVNF